MRTVEGAPLSPKELALLEKGEKPLFAARPSYATVAGGDNWFLPLLLVTDLRMLISKARVIGKPRADFEASWPEVKHVNGALWKGGGPQIELIVQTRRGEVELIVQPEYAVDVESAIRSGYL